MSCPFCTFNNDNIDQTCVMCGNFIKIQCINCISLNPIDNSKCDICNLYLDDTKNKICKRCECKNIQDNKTCYNCTLAHLTGGRVPEESDFTSAFLISGEISDQELKSLMDDLQAIEVGRSIQETYKEEDEDINSMWDDYCPKCYESLMACECGYVVRCSRCHEPASQCVCDENV